MNTNERRSEEKARKNIFFASEEEEEQQDSIRLAPSISRVVTSRAFLVSLQLHSAQFYSFFLSRLLLHVCSSRSEYYFLFLPSSAKWEVFRPLNHTFGMRKTFVTRERGRDNLRSWLHPCNQGFKALKVQQREIHDFPLILFSLLKVKKSLRQSKREKKIITLHKTLNLCICQRRLQIREPSIKRTGNGCNRSRPPPTHAWGSWGTPRTSTGDRASALPSSSCGRGYA